ERIFRIHMHGLAGHMRCDAIIEVMQCFLHFLLILDFFKLSPTYYTLPFGEISRVINLKANTWILSHHINLHSFQGMNQNVSTIVGITNRYYICLAIHMATDSAD